MRLLADEIDKLIEHYDQLAEKWQYEYMDIGKPSSQRAWERNEAMADALRVARDAQRGTRELVELKLDVLELDAGAEDLADRVRSLQRRVRDGEIA